MNPPDRIYLQWHGDAEPDETSNVSEEDVSWCSEKCFEHDVEYVCASLNSPAPVLSGGGATHSDVEIALIGIEQSMMEVQRAHQGLDDSRNTFWKHVSSLRKNKGLHRPRVAAKRLRITSEEFVRFESGKLEMSRMWAILGKLEALEK